MADPVAQGELPVHSHEFCPWAKCPIRGHRNEHAKTTWEDALIARRVTA